MSQAALEQRQTAIRRANQIRIGWADRRRELRGQMLREGASPLADALEQKAEWLEAARVRHALCWVPYIGPHAAREAMKWMGICWNEQIRDTSDAQRELLIRGLRS